jgi:replication fork clamp-binding protein CrfC
MLMLCAGRGYIAVKNRSQRDIQENLPIRTGLQKEHEYFQSHPRYRTVLSKCGTENLALSLNQVRYSQYVRCFVYS